MKNNQDWMWDIIVCPECSHKLEVDSDKRTISCSNPACAYQSEFKDRVFNLLPLDLDRSQKAENEFRVNDHREIADSFSWMNENQYATFTGLNYLTSYPFTSEYRYFRDDFSRRYTVTGRGLEIGGATGHASGFLKLFYPHIEIVTSDVAPINILLAEEIAEFVGFETDYFVMADAERLPFLLNTFDFIFSSGMLHHLGDLQQALQKGYTVLKPHGLWYIINELSIGTIPRMLWNSRWCEKGRHARLTGVHENSYTLKEWRTYFERAGFSIRDMYFHRNPNHKLRDWLRSFYYAVVSRMPLTFIKMGVPCEVCYVLEKTSKPSLTAIG
jgi:SAM-dependent methyltransferase